MLRQCSKWGLRGVPLATSQSASRPSPQCLLRYTISHSDRGTGRCSSMLAARQAASDVYIPRRSWHVLLTHNAGIRRALISASLSDIHLQVDVQPLQFARSCIRKFRVWRDRWDLFQTRNKRLAAEKKSMLAASTPSTISSDDRDCGGYNVNQGQGA
jgi:hypothetical protein